MTEPDFARLAGRFRRPGILAIALMGSHARGEASPFSDIDLVCFRAEARDRPVEAPTFLIDGHFVVVSELGPSEVEACFSQPYEASTFMAGLRQARPLWDPDGYFAAIQERARAFVWDAALQERADAWASAEMVGWIEEAQKGLAGLRAGDEGRLLNARIGLSWGLTKVVRVQRGILISGDNGSYPELIAALGPGSEWAAVSRLAFGLEGGSLAEQVRAGLRLYLLTAELLADCLRPADQPLIAEISRRIKRELGRQ